MPVTASAIDTLVGQLPTLKVRLSKDGETAEDGTGKNSLRSPALCIAELAAALARQPGAEPLAAGELISSGTLTASRPISAGERWSADVDGLALDPLQLHVA
jgi:2-oxo-3-hexenedioate decarboxylase